MGCGEDPPISPRKDCIWKRVSSNEITIRDISDRLRFTVQPLNLSCPKK